MRSAAEKQQKITSRSRLEESMNPRAVVTAMRAAD